MLSQVGQRTDTATTAGEALAYRTNKTRIAPTTAEGKTRIKRAIKGKPATEIVHSDGGGGGGGE